MRIMRSRTSCGRRVSARRSEGAVSAVHQPVEDRADNSGIGQPAIPKHNLVLTGDDGRACVDAVIETLEQIDLLPPNLGRENKVA